MGVYLNSAMFIFNVTLVYIYTGWFRETGNCKITLTKIKKINFQALLLKVKGKLNVIKCSKTKNKK